jgi:hypothetical protein
MRKAKLENLKVVKPGSCISKPIPNTNHFEIGT